MSFSSDVKNEMMSKPVTARHCMIAEVTGYIVNMSRIGVTDDRMTLIFESEHEDYLERVSMLLSKLYEIKTSPSGIDDKKSCRIVVSDEESIGKIFEYCRIKLRKDNDGMVHICHEISPVLIKSACCVRTYLQTAFLCCGSVTDPEKSYHLEFAGTHPEKLRQIQDMLSHYDIMAKMTTRKNGYVLYVKEGQQIVDCLNIMGAHSSLLNMENSIVMKEFRNNLNRKVNCETANLIKSANAGSRQKADIELLRELGKLEKLPETLREIGLLRLEYPDISLKELGEMCDPPVSKSCVNHRLRKLSEIAEGER
ncbi:MAG: DNA-binding protein WhiA [Lachnospiraceae bacterium]|nr:DNA-binding protein WhiA [Lachnospiraceae bacterium]